MYYETWLLRFRYMWMKYYGIVFRCELLKTYFYMFGVIEDVTVGLFYYFIIFQYHYVGKYHNNNYIS